MATDLRDAFILIPENIKANRQGQLTEQQRTKMRDMRLYSSIGSLLAIVVLVGLMLLFLVDLGKELDSITLVSLEGLLAMILIFISIYGITRWRIFANDLQKGQIAYISGKAVVKSYTVGKSIQRHYKITIENLSFDISSEAAKKLDTSRDYKLYYARQSKFILSIETI